MNQANPKVDAFLRKAPRWRKEFESLRRILRSTPLTEDLKWGSPCYTLDGSNVAILQGFKEYCALMFFKGTLLKDPKGILVPPGDAQAVLQARFTGVGEIAKLERVLKAYIAEAIRVEEAGLKVTLKKTSDFKIPQEFQNKLNKNAALKKAFQALTPGRQRGYLFYFSEPKLSKTRESRVEQCLPMILKGRGLND
jgi:uncharacterized protein YdeI (YjbR/CyaY-like superfamily)